MSVRDDWQQYVEQNINIDLPFRSRGYVADDDLQNFVANGLILVATISELTGIKNWRELNVLDIGCANGRLPIALDVLNKSPKRYMGFDVMRQPLEFCRKAFPRLQNWDFYHLNVRNRRYAQNNAYDLGIVDFTDPVYWWSPDKYDLIVANSVFTHLGHPENAEKYLKAVRKACTENTITYITWFKSPPNDVDFDEKRTVYTESYIRALYDHAGFKIINDKHGESTKKRDQWKIVATLREK